MDFLRFIFSVKFLYQLLIAGVVLILLVWGILFWLDYYTGHQKYIPVPDLRGKLLDEVMGNTSYNDYQIILMDSIYEKDWPMGTILSQDPFPMSRVKQNRKIYVTIASSIPDRVEMPDLKYLSLRQALSMLESYGLKVGNLYYTRSFDENAVQQQLYHGKAILPGTPLNQGSIIDLVVGLGNGSTEQYEEEITDTLVSEIGLEDYIGE